MRRWTLAILASLAACTLLAAQPLQDPQTMSARGAHVMGFDQDKTTHHFFLYRTAARSTCRPTTRRIP